MTSIEDFMEWAKLPVTKTVFRTLRNRIKDRAEELSFSAGIEPLDDRFKTGGIAALRDVVQIKYDDLDLE